MLRSTLHSAARRRRDRDVRLGTDACKSFRLVGENQGNASSKRLIDERSL